MFDQGLEKRPTVSEEVLEVKELIESDNYEEDPRLNDRTLYELAHDLGIEKLLD